MATTKKPVLNIAKLVFFIVSTLAAIVGGTLYITLHGLTWVGGGLLVGMLYISMMGISCGYHRYYSHRTHEAKPWIQFCYLFFASGAFENSCISWAANHRFHHRHVDTDLDPYNIKKGAFWAHIGWIIYDDNIHRPASKDLTDDPWLQFQAKYWIPIGIVSGALFPTLIGWLLGDAWGGFIMGGLVRFVIGHHLTFMINSLAHMIGSQPYNENNSARDSWITAFFTWGEGYHNFHHWKPGDYRNGVRMFHWDPPKWFIWSMSLVGQTSQLKRTPIEDIIKARAELLKKQLSRFPALHPKLEESFKELQVAVEELSIRRRAWMVAKRRSVKQLQSRYREEAQALQLQLKQAKKNLKHSHQRWLAIVEQFQIEHSLGYA